jgi:putative FmdB family regulatory protein
MPIYAYLCEECSFAKDVMQKMSEAPLTVCPSCGKSGFKKQLSAPAVHSGGSSAALPSGGCCSCPMAGPGGSSCS